MREIFARRPNGVSLRGQYTTFDEALVECGQGYDSRDIAAVVTEKTRRLLESPSDAVPTNGALLAIAALAGRRPPLQIVDIGGAAGAQYIAIRNLLPVEIQLDWVIVETSTMVESAASLSHSSEVRFSTDLGSALGGWQSSPDLVIASGSLMYLPKPLNALEEISLSSAASVVFARTFLTMDASARIGIQKSSLSDNGPGPLPPGFTDKRVKYPCTLVPRIEFERVLAKNHRISLRVEESSTSRVTQRMSVSQHSYVAHAL